MEGQINEVLSKPTTNGNKPDERVREPRADVVNINSLDNQNAWLQDPSTVYIGRGNASASLPASKWRNPFIIDDWTGLDKRRMPNQIRTIRQIVDRAVGKSS
mgnify:CR=1 FL=1